MNQSSNQFSVAFADHPPSQSVLMDQMKLSLESLGISVSPGADIVVARTESFAEGPSKSDVSYVSSGRSVLSVTHVFDGLHNSASDPLPPWAIDMAAELAVWMLTSRLSTPYVLRLAIPASIKAFRPQFTCISEVRTGALNVASRDTQFRGKLNNGIGALLKPVLEKEALDKKLISVSAASWSDGTWMLSSTMHAWMNQLMHVIIPRWSGSQLNCPCCS